MNYLTPVLYGCILGNFLLKAGRRLVPGHMSGRYVIIAEHCNYADMFVEVGRVDTKMQAESAWQSVDDSMFFMGIIYDLLNPDDAQSLANLHIQDFGTLSVDEKHDLQEARFLCGSS